MVGDLLTIFCFKEDAPVPDNRMRHKSNPYVHQTPWQQNGQTGHYILGTFYY